MTEKLEIKYEVLNYDRHTKIVYIQYSIANLGAQVANHFVELPLNENYDKTCSDYLPTASAEIFTQVELMYPGEFNL